MVDEEKLFSSLAVVQYEKCDLCRRHHQKKKGHVYTKAHRTILQNVITKFAKKISIAKKSTKSPVVHGLGWEQDARRWCYFCKMEVDRHDRDAMTTTPDACFLRHLASEEHKKNTLTFWREQRLEKDKHAYFLVEKERLEKYEEKWKIAVEVYLQEQELKRKTEAAQIARRDEIRQRLVTHERRNVMSQIKQTEQRSEQWNTPMPPSEIRTLVRTVAAKGEGLTVVTPKAYDTDIGNIYSGTLPPWLQADVTNPTESCSAVIGPTETDLKKHLVSEKKRKLPATRVGAKFDHQGSTGAGWLPSFGRVWSSQRRTHGQKHFMRALGKSSLPSAATKSSSFSASSVSPGQESSFESPIGFKRATTTPHLSAQFSNQGCGDAQIAHTLPHTTTNSALHDSTTLNNPTTPMGYQKTTFSATNTGSAQLQNPAYFQIGHNVNGLVYRRQHPHQGAWHNNLMGCNDMNPPTTNHYTGQPGATSNRNNNTDWQMFTGQHVQPDKSYGQHRQHRQNHMDSSFECAPHDRRSPAATVGLPTKPNSSSETRPPKKPTRIKISSALLQ